jgi:predicted DsbA family dithiol-disulfide isomerase
VNRVTLIVHSDYLCPWCYNGAVRVRRLRAEFGAQLQIEWRSFLLRPTIDPNRTLEKFKAYTRSWLRPAEDSDGGTFRVWATDAGPPSHSIPPHLVAKAAARLGSAAFDAIHARLLQAYFADNRDITAVATLRAIWAEAGLPAAAFERHQDPAPLEQVRAEHAEAAEYGIDGVPAMRLAGRDGYVMGAQPLEVYRRWIRRALDGE